MVFLWAPRSGRYMVRGYENNDKLLLWMGFCQARAPAPPAHETTSFILHKEGSPAQSRTAGGLHTMFAHSICLTKKARNQDWAEHSTPLRPV